MKKGVMESTKTGMLTRERERERERERNQKIKDASRIE
jgi:hypothetical protein